MRNNIMFAVFAIMVLLQNLAQISALGSCWTDGQCARHSPKFKTIPGDLTFSTLSRLILKFNAIEEVKSVPEMPRLTHLVLSYNRLKEFPWSSLHNAPRITDLELDNNEITRVDAYVDFPRSLTHLRLQSNRIASIPETFLTGAKPFGNMFYLWMWHNPLRCDCEAQWIARSRRCVLAHRGDGCVNTTPERVKTCMLANCNFHPRGVVIVLDVPENRYISQLIHTFVLKCNSPIELKGQFVRDVNLPTCPSNSLSTSVKPEGTEAYMPTTSGTQQLEKKELGAIFSGQMTTASNFKALAQVSALGSCWTDGQCARHSPKFKTIPGNLTFSTLSRLILKFNAIEEVKSVPEMPRLTHLVLSYNRLKEFPWSSLHNAPHITDLELDNNEITRVDAYVDFPRSLTHLRLQSNSIASIPETFLTGAKPFGNMFYLWMWHNPFRCDCEAEWIARSRRCVLAHRGDGCVNTTPERVKTCMLANCNFHPRGVVIILDVPENRYISQLIHTFVLKCYSPIELKGQFVRDVNLPTCPSDSLSTSVKAQGTEAYLPSTSGTQQLEKKELGAIFSGQTTTASNFKALAQASALGSCWTDGQCARHSPKFKTMPGNLTFSTLSRLVLKFNAIEMVTSVPVMPRLTHLVLSYNRLKEFPWSSLHNAPRITDLELDNNEITRVDAYVNFPRSLTHLRLQSNSIASIPETFLTGAKPFGNMFHLWMWHNPLRCDCEAEWIARSRRCVLAHRGDGCVNTTPERVKTCMLANCNFHPRGVVIILDVPENRYISQLIHTFVLKCYSPIELKGKFIRDVDLPTCPANSHSTSVKPQGTEAYLSSTSGTQQLEKKELGATFSGQMTTVSNLKAQLTGFWKAFTAIFLGTILAVLVVASFSVRSWQRRRRRDDRLQRARMRRRARDRRRHQDGHFEEETGF